MTTQSVEKTVVFIKPEAEEFKGKILKHLSSFGQIVYYEPVLLDIPKLRALYPVTTEQVWSAILDHLLGQRVLVIVIQGKGVVNAVFTDIGEDADPNKCGLNSLRYCLQQKTQLDPTRLLGDSTFYYRNFIHRSHTVEEAEIQMRALLNGAYDRIMNT